MTTINNFDRTCSVCGKTTSQPVLGSTCSLDYSDLDTRPAPLQRETMNLWVFECPHCGYVSHNIEKELELSPDFLKTDEYLICDNMEFKSELSKKFYRQYLIGNEKKDYETAFFALLHCTWACDDAEDELAVKIRKMALEILPKIDMNKDLMLIKADLLRRACQFDEFIRQFSDVSLSDELYDKIIKFQLELARKKDVTCYTVGDVLNE